MKNGFCDGQVITCSKHFWEWNAPDGSARESAAKPLHLYETKLEDGKIFAYVEHEFFYEYDD